MKHRSVTKFINLKTVAVALLMIGTAACGSTENAQQENGTNEHAKLEELYWAQKDSARMDFTEADVMFMRGMIAHHAQALIMSRMAPENGASKEIQTLASRIINAQKDEIATMQQWLRDRDQSTLDISFDGLRLDIEIDGEPFTHFRKMRGVLSHEKMKELANARGEKFDRLFLKYMIEHHSGAVYMVENLFATDGAAQDEEAFRLASDIQVDQRTEIDRMNLMLENLSQDS